MKREIMTHGRADVTLSINELERILDERRSELTGLIKERARLAKKLELLDERIGRLDGFVSGRGGRAHNDHSLMESIEMVLKKAGKPLRVSQIIQAVLAEGYRSHSANFRGIVNQTLIKDARFVPTSRGVYGLHEMVNGISP